MTPEEMVFNVFWWTNDYLKETIFCIFLIITYQPCHSTVSNKIQLKWEDFGVSQFFSAFEVFVFCSLVVTSILQFSPVYSWSKELLHLYLKKKGPLEG